MLIDTIKADWLAARKARETTKATLLGTLVGAIQTREKANNPERPLTEEEIISQVKKMLDGVVETKGYIENDEKYAADLVKANEEIAILNVYMPKQLSETAIEAFVRQTIEKGVEPSIKNLMSALKEYAPGAVDGKVAATVIKRVLSAIT